MKVEIIVRVDGREVGLMEQEVATAEALEFEESVERLKDRVGQALLETGFTRLASTLRQPWCCGRKMVNHGKRCWTVMSQSGPVALERNRYRCPTCKAWQTPADGVICCGTHRITRHLGRLLCQLATLEHFTRLEQLLLDQHGLHLGHDPMMKLVHDVGGAAEAERLAEVQRWREQPPQSRHWPEPEVTPQRVYVSCDGIMYCTHQTEPDPQNPGENRLIWKQMRVGCVYWQDEQQRWHKQVTWGQEEDFQSFGAALYRLACRCGYRQASEKIFAADGGEWCWTIQRQYFGEASGVLDWYHASQHVWAYPAYRAADWQIGSGMIESTAKQLVANPTNLYSAACGYAVCANAIQLAEEESLTAEQQTQRQEYIDLSFACLRESIAVGWNDFDHMQQDPDLAVLRDLQDFEELMSIPPPPPLVE